MNENLKKQIIPIASLIVVAAIFYGAVQLQERSSVPSGPQEEQMASLTYVAYEGEEGRTAAEILSGLHNVETRDFPGIGEFVSRIEGVPEDTSKYFWGFYVNGEMAQVGASQYVTKSGDFIEWKLEEIK